MRVHDSMYRMVGLAQLDAILDLPFKLRGITNYPYVKKHRNERECLQGSDAVAAAAYAPHPLSGWLSH